MQTKEVVKLYNAALDENEHGNIILRGVLVPETLNYLKVGPYQREILPLAKINDLLIAFETSSVPDIELGMRGGNVQEKNGIFSLEDPTYTIDGLQRVTTAKEYIKKNKVPRLGAIVHFNTTEKWERERFRILNTLQTRLSPNVLIRNMHHDYAVVEMMQTLCKDRDFVLNNKICWNQRMKRSELLTALTFAKVIGALHARFGPAKSASLSMLVPNLQSIYDKIGRGRLRENIKTFWSIMDECWQIRYVTFKESAAYLKSGFLLCLCEVLSNHVDFWDDTKLVVERDLRRKLGSFPVSDPEIARLCAAHGQAREILYQHLVKYINSGKRTKRLKYEKVEFRNQFSKGRVKTLTSKVLTTKEENE